MSLRSMMMAMMAGEAFDEDALAYITRVEAAGGTVTDKAWTRQVFTRLKQTGFFGYLETAIGAGFGVKTDPQTPAEVTNMFCFVGNDRARGMSGPLINTGGLGGKPSLFWANGKTLVPYTNLLPVNAGDRKVVFYAGKVDTLQQLQSPFAFGSNSGNTYNIMGVNDGRYVYNDLAGGVYGFSPGNAAYTSPHTNVAVLESSNPNAFRMIFNDVEQPMSGGLVSFPIAPELRIGSTVNGYSWTGQISDFLVFHLPAGVSFTSAQAASISSIFTERYII